MKVVLAVLPISAATSLLSLSTRTRNKKRLAHNESFLVRYGVCPAGKWKLPKRPHAVVVAAGLHKPCQDDAMLRTRPVLIRSMGHYLTLHDVVTGRELSYLGSPIHEDD